MSSPLKIAVFISGTGSNLGSIIRNQSKYNYQVVLVVSNKESAKGLDFAREPNIPFYTFQWNKEDKELWHLQEQISLQQCELIVLAGFMKILPEPFTKAYKNKIINIHPSLLPKYPGLHTHQRALDNGDEFHGATVHYVNEELDAGQRISQTIIETKGCNDADSLATRLLVREHSLFPYTIGLIAANRVTWQNDELYLDGEKLTEPVIFNE
ncbi:MAG TPA: phosphoribosylglycinamide formyltransferase [Gammaproteobacteria bacterium]|nr:phosphoribosylglycinamide formyltransferase [Xanthomonadales bacterium]MCB1595566.1 phosphoribosylglycinamide formyltransferase [Xanthomonadales bacterium]HOP23075.1 phosphoribosylglycinamide formyltransferase [Gammaproteobacteria bacterium]